jgi:plastocyanin
MYKLLIASIVGTLLVGLSLFFYSLTPEVYTVVRTQEGFEPSELTITQGDTVRFISETGEAFWPASDAHPSHGIYPAFDPKEPIEGSATWDFTFDEVGSWNYHDHISSHAKGKIHVYSPYGKSTQACLNRAEAGIQAQCWIEEFKLVYQEKGFQGIFDLFSAYQSNDTFFANNCHDVMHLVGDFAYEEYARNGKVFDQPETSYCAFGFYHGFIERMITETGDYAQSSEYCTRLKSLGSFASEALALDAEGACVHGFGHSIFDSLDGSLWGDEQVMVEASLALCEQLFTGDWHPAECGTGVWNALANALVSNAYNLTFKKDESPFWICRATTDIHKPGCYVELVTQYSNWNQNTLEEDWIVMAKNVEEIARWKTYFAYMADMVQWELPYDYKLIAEKADMCFSLETNELVESCLYGIHYGVLKIKTPFEGQAESLKICIQFADQEKMKMCINQIPKKV